MMKTQSLTKEEKFARLLPKSEVTQSAREPVPEKHLASFRSVPISQVISVNGTDLRSENYIG